MHGSKEKPLYLVLLFIQTSAFWYFMYIKYLVLCLTLTKLTLQWLQSLNLVLYVLSITKMYAEYDFYRRVMSKYIFVTIKLNIPYYLLNAYIVQESNLKKIIICQQLIYDVVAKEGKGFEVIQERR